MPFFVCHSRTTFVCHSRRESASSFVFALAFALASLIPATTANAQARMVDTTPPTGITAIIHGKLLTVTHGTLEDGTLLLQSGKILAVGSAASIKVPTGAIHRRRHME